MPTRTTAATVFVSLLGILALADPAVAQRPQSSAPSRGSQGGGGGGSRPAPAPSAPSRPSMPAPSSGGGNYGGGSRGSAMPAPPSRPAPSPVPSTPRYEAPPVSRGSSLDSPRGGERSRTQPTAPAAPTNQPRYFPPDDSARIYDSARNSPGRDLPPSASGSGRSAPDSLGVGEGNRRVPSNDPPSNGRVWQPTDRTAPTADSGWIDLSGATLPRRSSVPALTGSAQPAPAKSRWEAVERARRDSGLVGGLSGGRVGRTEAPVGEGSIRIPRSEITRESILQRYRGSSSESESSGARETGREGSNGLSRVRADALGERRNSIDTTKDTSRRTDAARTLESGRRVESRKPTIDTTAPKRGSVEAARREREGTDHLQRLRAADPATAKRIDNAGRAASEASNRAAQISIGVGLGFGAGAYAGWFWEPSCSPLAHHCGWWWNTCFTSPSWYWNHCSYGWPWGWGFGFWGGHWGFSYNNGYYFSPYSYGGYYGYAPYSYGSPYVSYPYWGASPVTYTTVIYESAPAQEAGIDRVPVAPNVVAGEGSIGGDLPHALPPGETAKPSADTLASITRGAAQYLALGDDAFRQGRYSDAVHHYARAIEYAPEDGVLYLILSDALFATGDYHYAAYALRRSLELDPKLLDNVVDKHAFYGDPSEFDKQIQLAESYLNEHFLDDDARLVLSANYLFAKRPAQASDLLASAFSKNVRETQAGGLVSSRAESLRAEQPLGTAGK